MGECLAVSWRGRSRFRRDGESPQNVHGNGRRNRAGSFNSRLQPTESYEAVENDPGRVLWIGCPNWGVNTNAAVYDFCPHAARTDDNGNLQSNTEYHGGAGYPQFLAFTQSYRYDGVNRLVGFSDSGVGSRSYGYDAYGNRQALEGNTVAYDGNNRIGGASYDAAGNQTVVNGDSLVYDAENRLTQATESGALGGGQATYRYDGDGRRVAKMLPGSTTVYVYDGFGQLAAEYSKGAVSTAACRTCYLSWDHLGSTRLVTDQEGKVVARHDYLPFGEEIPANTAGRGAEWGAGSDTVQQKFTGKEHDQESGLDYFGARYYGSALGRFTNPDPHTGTALHFINPQRWNMYAYGLNNPLLYTDPTGKDAIAVGFANEVPIFGHAGIISLHQDGTATYARYGPVSAGKPFGAGQTTVSDLPKVSFDQSGNPTQSSFQELTKAVARVEGQDPKTVKMAFFKTSEADTITLDNWIREQTKRIQFLTIIIHLSATFVLTSARGVLWSAEHL